MAAKRRSKTKRRAAKRLTSRFASETPPDPSDSPKLLSVSGKVASIACPARPEPYFVTIRSGQKQVEVASSDQRLLSILLAAAAAGKTVDAEYREAIEGQYVEKRTVHRLVSVSAEF